MYKTALITTVPRTYLPCVTETWCPLTHISAFPPVLGNYWFYILLLWIDFCRFHRSDHEVFVFLCLGPCHLACPSASSVLSQMIGFPSFFRLNGILLWGFRWLSGKESARQCRRHSFSPWVRKTPWRRKCQPTPLSLPRDPMDRGVWRATVHGVAKSWTWLRD